MLHHYTRHLANVPLQCSTILAAGHAWHEGHLWPGYWTSSPFVYVKPHLRKKVFRRPSKAGASGSLIIQEGGTDEETLAFLSASSTDIQPEPSPGPQSKDLGQFNPGVFNLGQFSPGQFIPGQFIPEQFIPGQFNPGQFIPGQFNSGQFYPGQFNPGVFNPR